MNTATELPRKSFNESTYRVVEVDGCRICVGFWQVDGEAVAATATRMRRFGSMLGSLEAAARWYRSAS